MNQNESLEVIPLASIRFDGGTQVREGIDESYTGDLAGLFSEDNPTWPRELPAGSACRDEDGEVWLWDGFHRYSAAFSAGCVHVPVYIRPGTLDDARWLACAANKSHGLRRRKGDVAKAVALAWQLKPNATTREIAAHVGCSHLWAGENNPNRPSVQKSTSQVESGNSFQKIPAESEIDIPGWAYEGEDVEPDAVVNDAEADDSPDPAPDYTVETHGGAGGLEEPSSLAEGNPGSSTNHDGDAFLGDTDDVGMPIVSEESASALSAVRWFDSILSSIRVIQDCLNIIAKSPGGELIRAHHLKLRCETRRGETVERFRSIDLDNLKAAIERFRPYAGVCPSCLGETNPHCKVCYGLPYVTEGNWKNCNEVQQERAASYAAAKRNAGA